MYSYNGEVKLNGFYRQQERDGNQINEIQKSSLLNAGIFLNTKNYIWTPKFLVVDIDGAYTPARTSDKFLVIPDQSENMDIRKFDTRLILFPENRLSLSSYFNYGQLYNNRENLSSMKSSSKNWGNTVFYRAKKFSFSLGNINWNQDETEIRTGRRFINKQNNFEGRVNNTFGIANKQELLLSHNEFYRLDYNKNEVTNYINSVNYNNLASFGKQKRNNLNTLISSVWQRGTETFNRYQVVENVSWDMSKPLKSYANYAFFAEERPSQSVYQNKIGGGIRHQLYESLQSHLAYEYNSTSNNLFNAGFNRGSLDLSYTKKIFEKHNLDLSYNYNLQAQKWKSLDGIISIINESVTLSDGPITLLSRPYINVNSIRVKDATSTIIYQLNFDYIITPQNNYMQIQRVPGGQIPNNTIVYVDYTAIQPGSFQYVSNNYLFSSGIYFFNRLFGFYFKKSVQDYKHLNNTDFITLNYITQQILGAKFEYKNLVGGIEYDTMNSTVLPYTLLRYYFNLSGALSKTVVISMNGSLYDYKKLNNVPNIQYADISGTATYHFRPNLSFNVSLAYRNQNGEGVDLNLLNFRTGAIAAIHKLRFSTYYNYYNRALFSEKIRFNAINFQISRIF